MSKLNRFAPGKVEVLYQGLTLPPCLLVYFFFIPSSKILSLRDLDVVELDYERP